MRRVVLLRHAKSSWDHPGLDDHARPLNKRGRRDAPRMGAWLDEQPFRPDWCLCSTATRAVETAELLREAFDPPLPWERLDQLYHASPEDILALLQELPDEIQAPLIVAHNPGLEELVSIWSGLVRPFPTAAISAIEFADDLAWEELELTTPARELCFQRPKELPDN